MDQHAPLISTAGIDGGKGLDAQQDANIAALLQRLGLGDRGPCKTFNVMDLDPEARAAYGFPAGFKPSEPSRQKACRRSRTAQR
jgi:hypothetical protein